MNRQLRLLTAVCLVATAFMSLLWTLLTPEFHDDPVDQLTAIADAGPTATLSVLGFVLSQLPFAIGLIGLAVWLRPVSPKLAITGGVLALLGAFGHTVIGGAMLLQPLMAESSGQRDAYAALLEDMESWPPMLPFFVSGLLGTVLGIVLLSIAHFRSHRQPRWIAPALWAFLALEFIGSNLSDYSAYLGGVCYLVALGALARSIAGEPSEQPREPAVPGQARARR